MTTYTNHSFTKEKLHMKITKEQLINPPKKYRPLPFWSWNSKLEVDETLWQVKEMDENGIGGYFMHARGGLKTEYMEDEWMDNVKAAVLEGAKRGMEPWGYDENGWPSGFGSGAVNGLGVKYQQKYLHMDITENPVNDDFTVANVPADNGKNMHFYFSVNRFYVDTMDAEVTEAFIKSTHEKYKKALGSDFSKMAGFFTDEPQMSRKPKGIPWSLILPEEYKKAYGEELIPVLHHLFITSEAAYRTRYRYFKLVTCLFSQNFMKKIYDWCNENGTRLTGHMVCEETFASQLDCNGSCMPNYMYMHIPGVDKLARSVGRDLLAPQVTSVCAQTGKKQILTESFALCGWDVSFEELKWILEWQMVKGVNLLCQHLEGYSLEGLRKRDYPAGHFYQNPWWKDYKSFMDFSARVGMLLADGKIKCEVLVLHTISSAWISRCDDHAWQQEVDSKYTSKLVDVIKCLDTHQIPHHLGDETVMREIASVSGGTLNVGEMSYKTVIVPPCSVIDSYTFKLLEEFKNNGGNLIFIGGVPEYIDGEKSDAVSHIAGTIAETPEKALSMLHGGASIINLKHSDGTACDIQAAYREFEDCKMYYFVNTYSGRERALFEADGASLAQFDYDTGLVKPYPFTVKGGKVCTDIILEPKGSVILFVYSDNKYQPYTDESIPLSPINNKLYGTWEISKTEKNALTLDYCNLYIDGEKIKDNIPVTDIQEIADSYEKQVNVRMDFTVMSGFDVPGDTYLVVEQPKYYDILINEKPVEKKECGYFRDKTFIKVDISGHIKAGTNTITLITDFVQPKHIYETIKDCYEFEAMRNKLWYDREIDAIYLLGDFCVKSASEYVPAPNRSFVTDGPFTLVPQRKQVEDGNIALQGYPFYTGKMTLKKTVSLQKSELDGRCIEFYRMGAVITKACVNGNQLPALVRAPYRFDLSGLLKEGVNEIEIELTSNFRNLLGPLHLGCESYVVGPASFHHNSKIFGGGLNRNWKDNYAFLEYGLFFK